MKTMMILIFVFVQMLIANIASAHPGSGIVVDKSGQVYIMDTGKGVWKIDNKGRLSYMPSSRFHWMALDEEGYFAGMDKNFGGFFERVTAKGSKPAIIICSDFPFTINKDGNLYYADTRKRFTRIVKRTPAGKESVLANDKAFEFVSGIAAGPDGSLYIAEGSNANANTIRKITMTGTVTIIATYIGKKEKDLPLETTPSYCRGLYIDSTGIIYVAATGSRCVLKVTPKGRLTTVYQAARPWTPTSVTVFQDEIYVLEWHDVPEDKLEVREAYIPCVRKVSKNGTVITLATVSRN